MLPYLPPLGKGEPSPAIVIACRREIFRKISGMAQRFYLEKAIGGFLDQDGYTVLAFDAEHTDAAAALAVQIKTKTFADRVRSAIKARGGDQ